MTFSYLNQSRRVQGIATKRLRPSRRIRCLVGEQLIEVQPLRRVRRRHGGKQSLGVRMNRIAKQHRTVGDFDDTPGAHHSDAIGDVRGHGLFIGIELVRPGDKAPDTDLAKRVINRLKDKGFLTSNAGPFANVVKIRPPLTFSQTDASAFLVAWDETIAEIAA